MNVSELRKALEAFAKQLKALTNNPQEHAREIIVLFGILIVFILLLMMFSLVARNIIVNRRLKKSGRLPPPPSPDELARQAQSRLAAFIATLALLFVIVAGLTAGLPHSSSFCGSCHRMKTSIASWKKSSHRAVDCSGCHQEPGALGWLEFRAAGLRNLSLGRLYLARHRPTVAGSMGNGACLSCHQRIARQRIVTKKGVAVSHRALVKMNYPCYRCHGRVGHIAQGKTGDVKRECLSCHRSAGLRRCGLCHEQDIGWQVAQLKKYASAQVKGEPQICKQCHSLDSCGRCHAQFGDAAGSQGDN